MISDNIHQLTKSGSQFSDEDVKVIADFFDQVYFNDEAWKLTGAAEVDGYVELDDLISFYAISSIDTGDVFKKFHHLTVERETDLGGFYAPFLPLNRVSQRPLFFFDKLFTGMHSSESFSRDSYTMLDAPLFRKTFPVVSEIKVYG